MEKSQAENILLDNPDKWEDWEIQFKAQAVSYNLVDQIFNNESFLNKPIEPKIANYRPLIQTRSQSSNASNDSDSTISSLTVENRENFKYNYLIYQEHIKAYTREIESIYRLRTWIKKTV